MSILMKLAGLSSLVLCLSFAQANAQPINRGPVGQLLQPTDSPAGSTTPPSVAEQPTAGAPTPAVRQPAASPQLTRVSTAPVIMVKPPAPNGTDPSRWYCYDLVAPLEGYQRCSGDHLVERVNGRVVRIERMLYPNWYYYMAGGQPVDVQTVLAQLPAPPPVNSQAYAYSGSDSGYPYGSNSYPANNYRVPDCSDRRWIATCGGGNTSSGFWNFNYNACTDQPDYPGGGGRQRRTCGSRGR